MKDQILEMLARGFKRGQLKEALGVSDSYISEVVSENTEKLEELKKKFVEERLDAKYTDIEESTLKQLKDSISMMETPLLLRTLEVVQKARQKAIPTAPINNFNITKVSLSLPASIQKSDLIVNSKAEIVGFGDQSLAALPSSALPQLFQKLKEKQDVPAQISPIEASC